jgi:threonine dehydratase
VTFPLCQVVIDRKVVVDEEEIANGIRRIAETEHWMVEGAARMALAGLVRVAHLSRYPCGGVLCGRNIAPRTFASIVERA